MSSSSSPSSSSSSDSCFERGLYFSGVIYTIKTKKTKHDKLPDFDPRCLSCSKRSKSSFSLSYSACKAFAKSSSLLNFFKQIDECYPFKTYIL